MDQDPSTSSPKKKENIKNHVLNETKEYFVGSGPDSPKTDVTVREEKHRCEDKEVEKREEELWSSDPEVGVERFDFFRYLPTFSTCQILHYHTILTDISETICSCVVLKGT